MPYTNGTATINEIFANTNVFGIGWIITIAIVFLTLILITRDPNKWKTLALPVTATWYLCGLEGSYVLIILAGIIFAVEAYSVDMIGQLMSARSDPIKQALQRERIAQVGRTIRGQRGVEGVTAKSLKEKAIATFNKYTPDTRSQRLTKAIIAGAGKVAKGIKSRRFKEGKEPWEIGFKFDRIKRKWVKK